MLETMCQIQMEILPLSISDVSSTTFLDTLYYTGAL